MTADNDKARLYEVLENAMGGYAKPAPDAEMFKVWIEWLAPYPLRTITIAFAEYCHDEDTFPPIPAAIAKRCKGLDGRPDAEEAWALSLACRDESATVVWTSEMAQAFGSCKAVLDCDGVIAARMAFKECYQKLVLAARIRNAPARWIASIGWDKQAAALVLDNAVQAGHIAIESVKPLMLAGPNATPEGNEISTKEEKAKKLQEEGDKIRANLKRVREMLGTLMPASAKIRAARDRHRQVERDALTSSNQEAAVRVHEFQCRTRTCL